MPVNILNHNQEKMKNPTERIGRTIRKFSLSGVVDKIRGDKTIVVFDVGGEDERRAMILLI
ncbi:MAG: hypothetical protein KJ600_06195 [Nanoarchaeota archaeon]|nr:hypothetical protein [Nanoarchaeota archaeon]